MKVKFSKIERTAGAFVMVAFAAFVFFTMVVAFKQGWFAYRTHYTTSFEHGDGLHAGTMVQMAGIRVGTVDTVTLNDDDRIEITMSVNHDYAKRVRQDSIARVIRPFIIGDKVVEITMGSKENAVVANFTKLKSEETLDLMDLLGGGKLGPYLNTIDSLLRNLQVVAEAFADPKRSNALIGMFDQILPTLTDVREMTQQMTGNKNLKKSMANLSELTQQVNLMLPAMAEFSKHLPELGENSSKMIDQVGKLTIEINKFLPAIAEIAPKLPEASQKSVEALREAVIVLRAMQKSFLLRGAVKDVQEEDAKRAQEEETKKAQQFKPSTKEREPANQ